MGVIRHRPVPLVLAGLVTAAAHAAGGDRCETATVVQALPFMDTGDTTSLRNDYMPACPWGDRADSMAPDAVYRYTPPRDETVTISLCGSGYDTKLYVYEGSCPAAAGGAEPLACSDDDCYAGAGRSLQSHLAGVALAGGVTYYVVVDGHLLASGPYVLRMSSSCAGCGPDAMLENEPNCGLDGTGHPGDSVNGGCNSLDPVFMSIAPGVTVCGSAAVAPSSGARDTDWYELLLSEESVVTWQVSAEFRAQVGIVDNGGVPDCSGASCFLAFAQVAACQQSGVCATLPPGTWWLVVAPFFQDAAACDTRYTATVTTRAPADLDADGTVGHGDLALLLDAWGHCSLRDSCPADLDGDDQVGITDLLLLLAAWSR